MASSFKDVTDSLGSLLSLPTREGNYASILCTSTGHQGTDQELTLSPKISLKDSCHSRSDPRLSKKEFDALLGLVQCGFHNSENQQIEPHSKRRKLNKTNDFEKISQSDENFMTTQYKLVSHNSPLSNLSSNDDTSRIKHNRNEKEIESVNNGECNPLTDTTQSRSLAETHASDNRISADAAASCPTSDKSASEVLPSPGENQSFYPKLISSFPMACLLEIAGTRRDNIIALIVELATYGDYRESYPNYQIPIPYRRVFDELCSQWSQGTTKNEFRKALLAYTKEKLMAQISSEESDKNKHHSDTELFGNSILESTSVDAVSRFIDEVGLIKEPSKNLLRHIFGRAREILNHLKDLNSKLQTENFKLRTKISDISDKLREIETQNQSKEADSTSYDCINPILSSNQDEIFKDLDCADLFGDAEVMAFTQAKEINNDFWVCCERSSIVEGQSLPETQDNCDLGITWMTHDTCTKCLRENNDKRFFIIREQVISVGWEKFRDIANEYAKTGKIFLPTIPGNIPSKSSSQKFSPAINPVDELVPSLSDVIPLGDSTFWDIDPAQAAAWSTQISEPALGLEPHTMERLAVELEKDNPNNEDSGLSMENRKF
ncbi:hypothetical protein HI914_03729 [Erysiphe necator]|nr:hypothetical protein HI914_03729 [Erysiphe necator]